MTPSRSLLAAALIALALPSLAQDVYVPPVLIGVKGAEGKVRKVNSPIPFPSENARWIRIRTPHFDIISSAPESETNTIARDLETLAVALRGMIAKVERQGAPATVFVFARRKESQPYFDLLIGRQGTSITGAYVRHSDGGTMFIDAARSRFERTAMHELIHDLLRQSDVVPPLWVEEGLAEYFSNAKIAKDGIVAGRAIDEHLRLLRNERGTVEEMFAVRAESSAATSSRFYAQSWAAVDWLMRLDSTRIGPFIRDLASGKTPETALQTHYWKTVDDLQRAVRDGGGRGKTVRIATNTDASDVAFDATDVARPTLLFELGRFLSYVAGAEEETRRHYQGALAIDPKHAPTLAAIGEFEKAIAADPNNADVHMIYAESLLTSAIGPVAGMFTPEAKDLEPFRKARALAEKALALGADEGHARGLIGTSYLVEPDVAPAIPYLERAHALAPSRMDFALHLYGMYLRTGDRAKADALFASTLDKARDKQTVFAARNLLLQHETDRANALTKKGRLAEAAVIIRSLAFSIDDSMARAELAREADRLDALAQVNKHIEMYNQAVGAANAGRKKDALQILDKLLAEATDVQVVRDAQRLRGEVRRP